jgi:hypothetical protein
MYSSSNVTGVRFEDTDRALFIVSEWVREAFGRPEAHKSHGMFMRHWLSLPVSMPGDANSSLRTHATRSVRISALRFFGVPSNLEGPFKPMIVIICGDATVFSSMSTPQNQLRYSAEDDVLLVVMDVEVQGDFLVRLYQLPQFGAGVKLLEFAIHTIFAAQSLDPDSSHTTVLKFQVASELEYINASMKFPRTSRVELEFKPASRPRQSEVNQ